MTPSRLYTGLFTGSLLALSPILWAQESVTGILESTSAFEGLPFANDTAFASSVESVSATEGKGMIGVLLADGTGRAAIETVIDDSPAEAAGLEAGDKILSVNGQDAENLQGLIAQLKAYSAGDEIELVIERDGWRKHMSLTLADADDLDLPEGPEDLEDGETDFVIEEIPEWESDGDFKKSDQVELLRSLGYVSDDDDDDDHEHEHDGHGHDDDPHSHGHEGDLHFDAHNNHEIKDAIVFRSRDGQTIDLKGLEGLKELKHLEHLKGLEGAHGIVQFHGKNGEMDLGKLHEHLEGIEGLESLKGLDGIIKFELKDGQGGQDVLFFGDGAHGAWKTNGECEIEIDCDVECDVECETECETECEVECDVLIECDGTKVQGVTLGKLPTGVEAGELHRAHFGGQHTSRGFFFNDKGEAHEIEFGDGEHHWTSKDDDQVHHWVTKDGDKRIVVGSGAGKAGTWISKGGDHEVIIKQKSGGSGHAWTSEGGEHKVHVGHAEGNSWFGKSGGDEKVVEKRRIRIQSKDGTQYDVEIPDIRENAVFEWRSDGPGEIHGLPGIEGTAGIKGTAGKKGAAGRMQGSAGSPHAELEELRAELKALRAEIKELRGALRRGGR